MRSPLLVAAAWTLAVALASARSGAQASLPNVLLITVDTLRPDALGWVAARNATPHVDALAREAFRFPAAVSPVPLTLPAHASLMTGLHPPRHGVRDNGHVLGGEARTLAEALRGRGYATAAVVSGYPLRALFGLDRGFDRYDDALPVSAGEWQERPAPEATRQALEWVRSLRRAPGGDGPPWFLWVHYFDPHDPYVEHPGFRRSGPRGAYEGEVAFTDDAIGALRRGLAETGAAAPLLTVFAADHGEGLGEHGEDTHGFFVYDSTTLVPLLVHFPGLVPPGESAAPARLVDVAPTVLDLLGLPALADVDGVNLRPTLLGKRQEVPPAYLETWQPWLGYGWAPLAAVRAEGWKLIDAPRPELYDLRRDPGERTDRLAAEPRKALRLRDLLRGLEGQPTAPSAAADDPEALERLRALGYVGGGATSAGAPPPGLADPKDRLALRNRLSEAERALSRQAFGEALAAFDAVLEAEPANRYALLRSGVALVRLGRLREAVARLDPVARADPRQAEARYALADALTRLGERARAAEEWTALTRLQPRRATAWSNLGAVLLQRGRTAQAADALARAAALDPASALFAENLGEARYALALEEAAAGRRDAAARALREALAASPGLRSRAAADARLAPLLRE